MENNKHYLIMKVQILVQRYPEIISTLNGIDLHTTNEATLKCMHNTMIQQVINIIKIQASNM